MNGSTDSVEALLNGIVNAKSEADVEVVVAPSFPYLAKVEDRLAGSNIKIAAQNCSAEEKGAFTGEVSIDMLKDFSVEYVLTGHSERRTLFGESDQDVAEKTMAVLSHGLKPILCIGETLEEREKGETIDVCARQVNKVIDVVGVGKISELVIAYEPVWAIGTGLSASAGQAQEVHEAIRSLLAKMDPDAAEKVQILYGGSVKASNSAALFAQKDIDGALVGGASLVVEEFVGIIEAAGQK